MDKQQCMKDSTPELVLPLPFRDENAPGPVLVKHPKDLPDFPYTSEGTEKDSFETEDT